MKITISGLSLILVLLFSSTLGMVFVDLVSANPMFFLPTITIKSDGNIEPKTDFIKQTGNEYTLVADLAYKYAVIIQCSNIVFDGNGHIVNGTLPSPAEFAGWHTDSSGLDLENVTNVTVRNIEITGFNDFDVSIKNCQSCNFLRVKAIDGFFLDNSSLNAISESYIAGITEALQPGLFLSSSNSNKFYTNNITDLTLTSSSNNVFFENNFVINNFLYIVGNNWWDNSSVGNYWSDYSTRYPNASGNGDSGIGDIPYVIDANNIDNYPLMAPYTVPHSPLPTPEPKPEQEAFPTTLTVGVSGVTIACVAVSALYFYKKRKSRIFG